ncbi:glycoside hydrolase family 43 protein [Mobilitalea sibirica]|uniref:Glycoside hydrolase family 43 protein n=1 Tax=Mobilitalea sibirica TaxID=1462919 RepID=A0A8J7HCQ1_9FIRM|nr:glycoside hydrolase family 43 protein [Mobilitalea sibirica]MBH1940114.1 glycoside hydrolase family 43 protein [Mobilitalea sibirica]
MNTITNPILKGFNPDPSILRVGEDYYIATSTFEWFPGVQIHHSKDLINWKLIARPLNRVSQLDMRGASGSEGVWAPCLSYDKGVFYLIYTNVKLWTYGGARDLHNYLVTTTDITGEWSEPIYLNSSGFDPSLFHDDDGRKYLVNQLWDHRKGKNQFAGIVLQEYSPEEERLVGPITNIFKGTELGLVEGPHLYKRNGYYYLLTAEGGTRFKHAVTFARSKDLLGPYEVHPTNPILTSWTDPTLVLQRAGHGDLVETPEGEWYMVHLCGRPIPSRGRCILGRETAIQKMVWREDDWIYLEAGGNKPQVTVPAPNVKEVKWEEEPHRDDFNSSELNIHYQTLRMPLEKEYLSLTDRPGYLRLRGSESLGSKFHQSLIARRQQAFCYTASTVVEFEPDIFQQQAGLVTMYDNNNFYYLHITLDEEKGKVLEILKRDAGVFDEPLKEKIVINDWEKCYLRVEVDYHILQFYYSKDGEEWIKIGPEFDASILSDEYTEPNRFTGAFVGLCCQDLSGQRKEADFDYFEYIER